MSTLTITLGPVQRKVVEGIIKQKRDNAVMTRNWLKDYQNKHKNKSSNVFTLWLNK